MKPDYLIEAMATLNGDPFMIETEEEAEEVYNLIEQCDNHKELTAEDGEDFEVAANQLDIDLNEYNVKVIYRHWITNGNSVLICLPADCETK